VPLKIYVFYRPGEWSIYQGYLESLTRLIEANYAPIAEDDNSWYVGPIH
jgi:hypothetical protein